MTNLPTVTLLIIDCVDAVNAANVLEICKRKCNFGAVKLLTSQPVDSEHRVEIMPLDSLIAYSIFMLTKVHQYVDTEHMLIVQRDGWILNGDRWNDDWLKLDYIAPLFMQYDKVGSGGFSLRSKRLMQHMANMYPDWDGSQEQADQIQSKCGYYEDGEISFGKQVKHFNIATCSQAADFAQGGNRNPKYFRERPFGFHRTFQQIDFKTGIVDSSNLSKDIHVNYDHEIKEAL